MGTVAQTYADERIGNKFLYAILNASQPKRCLGWPRPSVIVLRRAASLPYVLAHSLRYHEREMSIGRARWVVLW